jgi:hypothetical protein
VIAVAEILLRPGAIANDLYAPVSAVSIVPTAEVAH